MQQQQYFQDLLAHRRRRSQPDLLLPNEMVRLRYEYEDVFFRLSLYHLSLIFGLFLYISHLQTLLYPFLTDICSLGLRESQKAYTFWSPGGAKVFIISISFLESRKPSFPPCTEICKKVQLLEEMRKSSKMANSILHEEKTF